MDTIRRAPTIAGILLLFGMIAGILSVVPVIEQPNYLSEVSFHKKQVISGTFFQFLMIPTYLGFALVLYPILRKYNEALSLGFVGFRVMSGTFHLMGVIGLPLIFILGQDFIQAGTPVESHFQIMGELLRSGRDLVNHVAMILAMGLGDLMFFSILYSFKLVPRWLSCWGLFGTVLSILASLFVLFQMISVLTPGYMVLNIPLALQGIVFALWLIAKGFNQSKRVFLDHQLSL